MSYQIMDKLLFLTIFVTVATFIYKMFPFAEVKSNDEESKQQEVVPVTQQTETQQVSGNEIQASPLVVRHLTDKATLLVRYRASKRICTAHLIVWSGAKRKSISDSYYDLGTVQDVGVTEAAVESLVLIAKEKLVELAEAGKRKRKIAKEVNVASESVESVVEQQPMQVVAEQPANAPEVVVEDTPPEGIKLRRFPSVYRGVITEIGMMDRNNGKEDFKTFGVRYLTQEGVVGEVYGANLQAALHHAKASVGDHVEIMKIGRKTIDSKKAPMNLFTVAKLAQPAM